MVCFHLTGLVGLAILYSLMSLDNLDFLVRELAEFENIMTSVERALAYTRLDVEPGYLQDSRPPENWPKEGKISFEGVSQVYYEGGTTVLRDVILTSIHDRRLVLLAGQGRGSLLCWLH